MENEPVRKVYGPNCRYFEPVDNLTSSKVEDCGPQAYFCGPIRTNFEPQPHNKQNPIEANRIILAIIEERAMLIPKFAKSFSFL